jgi:predicted PurR-regulated permease PerM
MISIIIPVSFTSYIIVDQIPKINQTILEKNTFDNLFENIPFKEELDRVLIKNKINPNDIEDNIIKSTKSSLNSFGKKIISFGTNTLELIMNFFLMIYIIFFGLKDGKKYLLRLSKILPLGDKTERRLFKKFSSIVRSIFKGTLIVSIIQGLLAGFLFYLVGFKGILI